MTVQTEQAFPREEQLADICTSEFRSLERGLFSGQPSFLRELRKRSMSRFRELGFPTTRMEDWKNTSVSPIANSAYLRPVGPPGKLSQNRMTPFFIEGTNRIVILNGRFSPGLSSLDRVPPSVEVKTLPDAIHCSSEKLEPFLGQIADYHNHAFVALNTAFIEEGVFVHIPEGVVLHTPLHLLYVAAPGEETTLFHPRNLIYAGPNSKATIIEQYIALNPEPNRPQASYLTNLVTEMVVDENGWIQHIKLQQESPESHHVCTTQILQRSHSSVSTISISSGGKLTRNDVNVVLDGEGCECRMHGLVLAKGRQHVDNHTFLDHAKPHCTSHELYKGIYGDRSHGIFNGRIVVRKDAQKTNADQANQNLLLSRQALVNSNPQLEINADDVRCTHGSTTGQVNQEAVFYLRSRGLDEKTARFLLIHGFASEIIHEIQVEPVRNSVSHFLHAWLLKTLPEAIG